MRVAACFGLMLNALLRVIRISARAVAVRQDLVLVMRKDVTPSFASFLSANGLISGYSRIVDDILRDRIGDFLLGDILLLSTSISRSID